MPPTLSLNAIPLVNFSVLIAHIHRQWHGQDARNARTNVEPRAVKVVHALDMFETETAICGKSPNLDDCVSSVDWSSGVRGTGDGLHLQRLFCGQ
jgi:hypothetical protein